MTVEQRPAWYQDPVGYVREGIEESRGSRPKDQFGRPTGGGLIDSVVGGLVSADDGSDYRTAATNETNKEAYKARIEALKGTFTPGRTKGEYEQQLVELNDKYKDDRFPKTAAGRAEARQTKAQEDANNLAQAQLQTSNAQFNSTNQRLLAQGAQSHQLALIQAADARDASAQSLALQQQQLIREDQRYNERMEQLDRRDRKQGRQSLIAGLAALGAAFAL